MNEIHTTLRGGKTCEGQSSTVPHGAFPIALRTSKGVSFFFALDVLPYIALKTEEEIGSNNGVFSNTRSGSSSSWYGLNKANSRLCVITARLLVTDDDTISIPVAWSPSPRTAECAGTFGKKRTVPPIPFCTVQYRSGTGLSTPNKTRIASLLWTPAHQAKWCRTGCHMMSHTKNEEIERVVFGCNNILLKISRSQAKKLVWLHKTCKVAKWTEIHTFGFRCRGNSSQYWEIWSGRIHS